MDELKTMKEKLTEMFLDRQNRSCKPSARKLELKAIILDLVKHPSQKGVTANRSMKNIKGLTVISAPILNVPYAVISIMSTPSNIWSTLLVVRCA